MFCMRVIDLPAARQGRPWKKYGRRWDLKYQVQLEIYKGPLELLLKRVTREELPAEQISVSAIIDQFVEYLSGIAIDIEEGSRFLYLAAALLAVKARLLLPCHGDEEKEEDYLWDEDHEGGLSESAINEYLVFREAAASLEKRAKKWRMSHRRPVVRERVPVERCSGDDLTRLVKAFQGVLQRISSPLEPYVVEGITFNIDEVMEQLFTRIQTNPDGLSFKDIFNKTSGKEEVIITFLAVLELIYQGKVSVRQDVAEEVLLIPG
ncbi:MAG TPA: hypothetical protein DCG84_01975 [Peptococcaceae bacterium]|nr:hypothetical protein [Peptococcaceae bacterium]